MRCEIIPDPGRDGTRVRVHPPAASAPFDVSWSGTALKMLRARGVETSADELTRGLVARQPDILEGWQREAAAARQSQADRVPILLVHSRSVRILNDVLASHGRPLLGA